MQAKENKIIRLLSTDNTQFSIPVYQRNYNWEKKQCDTLLKDILKLSDNKEIVSHFIGSIVYLHEGVYSVGKNEFSIIDGQQRLTTITILLMAIRNRAIEFGDITLSKRIYNKYLTDEYIDDVNKIKLLPVGDNLTILKKILENDIGNINESEKESNIFKNYQFFFGKISNLQIANSIMYGLDKIIYVDIALEKGKDDPQRIFESLNSTGLDLSQADLIRNFILMDLDRDTQNKIYEDYWVVIENNTKVVVKNKIKTQLSEFMRDYLTFRLEKIPNQNKVFEEFKSNYNYENKEELENTLKAIVNYSNIYSCILNPDNEINKNISKHLKYLNIVASKVINPFLMGVYMDYKKSIIDEKCFIDVLELLQSYLWRRYICSEPTNTLNTLFMNLYSKIDKNDYCKSIERHLLHQKFPDNKYLKECLKTKNVYNDVDKLKYVFERIENENHSEKIDFSLGNITIEHIFPQKPVDEWKSLLSESEYETMESLKHTISNLTITGSNSNLANKVFLEKRDMNNFGYRNSKFLLNRWLGEQSEWNFEKLEERFNDLFKYIIEIWKRP